MKPLGKNKGRYHGQTIDIHHLLADTLRVARHHGWQTDEIQAGPGCRLPILHRVGGRGALKVYLSAGIHGDEPAGPQAIRQLLDQDDWFGQAQVWICPCLNPDGFVLNQRENREGIDLNRDYRFPHSAEVRHHIQWLSRQPPFDMALCLHEDWEADGFYLYELGQPRMKGLAESMVDRAAGVCPISRAGTIDGRPARQGIIRPDLEEHRQRTDWPEALYLVQHKTACCHTLEAPSDFPMETRANALLAAVKVALDSLSPSSPALE